MKIKRQKRRGCEDLNYAVTMFSTDYLTRHGCGPTQSRIPVPMCRPHTTQLGNCPLHSTKNQAHPTMQATRTKMNDRKQQSTPKQKRRQPGPYRGRR